jgi:hypothetical protein
MHIKKSINSSTNVSRLEESLNIKSIEKFVDRMYIARANKENFESD